MRAAITGLGAVCGAGRGVDRLWELLLKGGSAVRRLPALSACGLDIGPLSVVDPAEDGSGLLDGADRAEGMALAAAEESWRDAQLPAGLSPSRVGVVVGTTLGGKADWLRRLRQGQGGAAPRRGGWSYGGPARAVATRIGAGHVRVVSNACASGNAALGVGLDLIRDGTCDVVLAGGVDALHDFVIAGFGALKAHAEGPCQPFDADRRGLNLGEGAGFLVLEPETTARRPLALLSGHGLSLDANHMTGPDRDGAGCARALLAALDDAGRGPEQVDFVSLHGTATRFNDLMEAQALHRALGARAAHVPVNSIKGALGHTLGAAGALEAIMAVLSIRHGLIPPTAGHACRDAEINLRVVHGAPLSQPVSCVLSTSSGFGGLNASIVIEKDPHAA